jgi:glycerol-3-phosphate dehydrogenase (NAD(P)+)
MSFDRIGVIGGGAWGTALAQVGASGGRDVLLWARETEVVESVNAEHENRAFLPGQKLSSSIRATGDLADLQTCEAWLWSRRRSICAPCSRPRRRATSP